MEQIKMSFPQLFQKEIEKGIENDKLSVTDKIGQIIGMVMIGVCLAFLYLHHTMETGFFTSKFGPLEAFLFYIPVVLGFVPMLVRMILGSKNRARLFDIANTVIIVVALGWLLGVWPFDFAHFADPLPLGLKPIVNWISNGLVQLLATLLIPLLVFVISHESIVYVGIREGLEKRAAAPTEPPAEEKKETPAAAPEEEKL